MITSQRSHKNLFSVSVALSLVLSLLLMLPVSATTGTLTYYPSWTSGDAQTECAVLGFPFGTKVDSPTDGTYPLNQGFGSFTLDWNVAQSSVDWSATIGIDAVILKAGTGANVYSYAPEAMTDSGLQTPEGKTISHITFCYDFELTATKTANALYTRTYEWTIKKSVDPATHTGFAGDTFKSDYEIVIEQTVTDSDFAVAGDITVNNPTPFTVNFSASDFVNGTDTSVNCPTTTLIPGASTTCTYRAELGDSNPGNGTNIATITSLTTNVGGATASAAYVFGDPTTTVGYPIVNVSDSVQGDFGSVSGDTTFTYSRDFACPTDPSVYSNGSWSQGYPNTATIDKTGQNDSAEVAVSCYIPMVSKTANTRYARYWEWMIDKSADQTELTLSAGQLFDVNYQVTVSADYKESGFEVYGQIAVQNPNPTAEMVVALADSVAGTPATIVKCTGGTYNAGTLSIPANGAAVCDYTAALPGKTGGTNTATVSLNSINFSATADYAFGKPASETDECVTVTDDYGTSTDPADDRTFGTVCATPDDMTESFTYVRSFGPYSCGDVDMRYTITNIASFVSNDTGNTGNDDHTVTITVPACQKGCTLTQGYWKTHSSYGPAPYDDTWLNLGDADKDGVAEEGADESFFLSGKSWYQVFWTAPAGNPYYNLAHQYMAAKLNVLNGAATTPEVNGAISWAETFFNSKTPTSTLSKPERANVLRYTSILDNYNNGLVGPGHCSENMSVNASATQADGSIFLPLITTR